MSVKMHGGLQETELYFSWEPPGAGERVRLDDRVAARSFLARLHARGDALSLRRLAAAELAGARLDDDQVLDQLALWIASGKIRIALSPRIALSSTREKEEVAESPEMPWDAAPPSDPAVVVEEAMPPESIDMVLQAETLRRAAQDGLPFCEECEKAKAKQQEADDAAGLDQAAQAAALQSASEAGAPVCEECEKAAAAEKKKQ